MMCFMTLITGNNFKSLYEPKSFNKLYKLLYFLRRVWDSNMIESLEIGLLNVNNDVGYYASKFYIILNA